MFSLSVFLSGQGQHTRWDHEDLLYFRAIQHRLIDYYVQRGFNSYVALFPLTIWVQSSMCLFQHDFCQPLNKEGLTGQVFLETAWLWVLWSRGQCCCRQGESRGGWWGVQGQSKDAQTLFTVFCFSHVYSFPRLFALIKRVEQVFSWHWKTSVSCYFSMIPNSIPSSATRCKKVSQLRWKGIRAVANQGIDGKVSWQSGDQEIPSITAWEEEYSNSWESRNSTGHSKQLTALL